jgi:hypothetical protein
MSTNKFLSHAPISLLRKKNSYKKGSNFSCCHIFLFLCHITCHIFPMLSLLAGPPRHPTPPIHLQTSSLFSIRPPHEVSPLSLMFSTVTIATAITTAIGGMAMGLKAQTMMMTMAMATAA